jgi:probable F420-dependent oxidoreductase
MIGRDMRVEAIVRDPELHQLPALAERLERLGFDGLSIPEIKRDPFVLAGQVGSASFSLRIATGVALAFPRSPTVTAYSSRTIHDLTGGRFVLGLGTQVRGHIERRFGVPWAAPVQRLREYIEVVRAVWRTWDAGDGLSVDGQHYRVSLMTPEFSPSPNAHAAIPIQIGAVNTHMLRLAGEACDGVRLHPFCTPRYLQEVALPNLASGAEISGRPLSALEIVSGGFIATGPDEQTVVTTREEIRRQIAFYASTRGYAPVLELHGWSELGGELRRLIVRQGWSEMATLITDEMLDAFAVAGAYEHVGPLVKARLGGLVDTLSLNVPADEAHDEAFASLVRELQRIPGRDG